MTVHDLINSTAHIYEQFGAKSQWANPSPIAKEISKWPQPIRDLSRSAFQKAIRRSLVEDAVFHGLSMLMADEVKAWHTLSLVAAEDVSLGNPNAVFLTCMTQLKTFRNKLNNPWHVFVGTIIALCLARKSRFPCVLTVYCENMGKDEDHQAEIMGAVAEQSDAELLDQMTGKGSSLEQHWFATVTLRKRARNGNVQLLQTCLDAITEKTKAETPEVTLAALLSFERANDSLHYGLTATVLNGTSIKPHAKLLDFPHDRIEQYKMPMAALDKHTQLGSSALTRYVKTHMNEIKAEHPYLKDADQFTVKRVIGAALFFAEGAKVHLPCWVLPPPVETSLFHDQLQRYFSRRHGDYEFGINEATALIGTVAGHLPVLNEMRKYFVFK